MSEITEYTMIGDGNDFFELKTQINHDTRTTKVTVTLISNDSEGRAVNMGDLKNLSRADLMDLRELLDGHLLTIKGIVDE